MFSDDAAVARAEHYRIGPWPENEGSRRLDADGRDVTDLPGLWSPTDKFVGVDAASEPDRQVETAIEPALPEELF